MKAKLDDIINNTLNCVGKYHHQLYCEEHNRDCQYYSNTTIEVVRNNSYTVIRHKCRYADLCNQTKKVRGVVL